MSVLATAAGAAKVDTTPAFNRTTTPQGMSKDAVTRAFTLAKGQAGSAPDTNDKTRIVFKVTEITPAPALTEAQRTTVTSDLRTRSPTRRFSEYVLALQKRLGTHIFEDEFKKATGRANDESSAPVAARRQSRLSTSSADDENKARSNGSDADARRLRRAL